MEAIFYRGGVGCLGVVPRSEASSGAAEPRLVPRSAASSGTAEPRLVPRSEASSGLVEPWLVSLSNHGLMVEQTLKQVQGDSRHSGPRPGICGR